ncbi:siroheme synthase CysG [Kaistia terrae]|uniref:Siroheme synthase CysG n=1 Tax=Kaistia terrae TaxID=537017 RepID=A0ABW0PRK7_9HYPH|nr:siroheme synthase CysG [Kaistia terrae]MCX5578515.1 siroheme synthase CysG [Kaistia terrae]
MPLRQPRIAAPRIAPLAVLPVFLRLEGKCVLIVGHSAAAAWKAELLAATGATACLACVGDAPLAPELAALVEAGRINVVGTYGPGQLRGMAIAVFDAETDEQAAQFRDEAIAAGVPHNVIDRPDFCSFQFGGIVNRSPVVIGISTSGAAPILGQAVRRRIEFALPPALAGWATLAMKMRRAVLDRLQPGAERRRFWERFSDLALGQTAQAEAGDLAEQLIDTARHGEVVQTVGRVTLVGAGPGDPDLLTVKAVRALQAADVILFDDLVSDGVLELARREARRMLVGKRGGRASCSQDDINAMALKLARQGKNVVRLKSGDPMVFGRAGEEIEALRAEGIAVEVIPGITAASALASSLGASLTHRDHAHSVRFVTGHGRDGEMPDLDWRGLADPETTLAVYMGGRTAPEFARRLLAQGRADATPVVLAQSVSRPEQSIRHATLGSLATELSSRSDGPVLVGIGEAFQFAATAKAALTTSQTPTLLFGT